MKNKISLVILSTALMSGKAFAADMIMPTPFVPVPVYDDSSIWTGMYAGLNAGYAWGRTEITDEVEGTFDHNGFVGGAQIGYNWAMEGFLVGIEADYQFADNVYSDDFGKMGVDHFGTLRARVGADIGGFLPYVTGGLAFGNTLYEVAGGDKYNEYRTGWTVGAGVEAAVASNISVKAEYLYVDLGKSYFDEVSYELSNQEHIVRLGVNFHF